MIPSTVLGFLLAVAAVSPGYVYVRFAASRRPRSERSSLTETAEYLIWGVTTIGVGAMITLGLAEIGVPGFLTLDSLIEPGHPLIQAEPWRAIATGAAAYGLALAAARLAAMAIHRGESPSMSEEPVWWTVFGKRDPGEELVCSITLSSGRIVEGFLFSYTTDNAEPRDVALKPPLWFWEDGVRYSASGVDRVIVAGREIVEIDARLVKVASP